MNVLSLFDGISCGHVALERAGIQVDNYFASEIDKYAIKVTQNNYPDTIQLGDIENIDFTKFKGEIDLAIGGSPCTYWSIAKTDNREITSDGMGFDLFMQYVRALEESETRYFFYENNYSIHKDIQKEITKYLGVEPIKINSSLVSAQNRERLYWTNIPNVTQPRNKGIFLKDVIENGVVDRDKSQTILSTLYKENAKSMVKRNKKGLLVKSDVIDWGQFSDGNWNYRKFTPLECERLQTLSENYTNCISNTQRYKCIGNGWTVDVIANIFKSIPGTNQIAVEDVLRTNSDLKKSRSK